MREATRYRSRSSSIRSRAGTLHRLDDGKASRSAAIRRCHHFACARTWLTRTRLPSRAPRTRRRDCASPASALAGRTTSPPHARQRRSRAIGAWNRAEAAYRQAYEVEARALRVRHDLAGHRTTSIRSSANASKPSSWPRRVLVGWSRLFEEAHVQSRSQRRAPRRGTERGDRLTFRRGHELEPGVYDGPSTTRRAAERWTPLIFDICQCTE